MCPGEQDDYLGDGTGCNPRDRLALARQVMKVCLPAEIAVQVPGLGEVVGRPVVLDRDAAWISNLRRSCEGAWVECSGSGALLLVESTFALRTVNAILGCEQVAMVRPLSRIERGLLHGALAALSAQLGLLPAVQVCPGEVPTPNLDSLVIEAHLGLHEVLGRVWVCASVEFLAQLLTSHAPTLTASTAQVVVELGRTSLPFSELAGASERDVVVFDGVAALSEEEAWPVQIRRGDAVVPALLRPDGALIVGGGTALDAELGTLTRVEGRAVRSGQRSGQLDGVAANSIVEVTAEIGRLHGAALAGLLSGTPFDMGRSHPVLLRRNGTAWAEGERLALDDALAVRITRKVAD
jgi:flagellar motor switch/type III secretory pathway protein FliN